VNGIPTVSIAPDTTKGCTPQCVTFTATNNPAASNYSWSFGNGQSSSYSVSPSATMCYTTTGNYSVILTLTDINGCVNTATASVMAYPIPNPEFVYNPNPATILSPQIQFINQSSGAIITSYNWNFGDASGTSSTLYNPSYTYADTGTYYVTLIDTSINGCWASIVQPVIIEQDFTLYVPNAFTPNGDGKNEVFKAQGDGILSFTMYIFDRWGNPIFTSNDINTGWNGRRNNSSGTEALQEDVYVWKIDLSSVVDKQSRSYTGIVTLLK
jgi:gliding motility-associated-like protein